MVLSKWDEKYAAAPTGLFGSAPNEYARQITARSDFRARTALCIADGDGRNSRFLALRGIAVTAVDLSPVGCANGEALDAAAGVSVKRIVGDVVVWQPAPAETWDAVFVMYLQAPQAVRMAALRCGFEALGTGGILAVEGFSKAQAGETGDGALGPGSPELMYDLDEIHGCLPEAQIVEAFSGRVRLDQGGRHRGLAHVVRFAGRKL